MRKKPAPEVADYQADFGEARALHHAKYWFMQLDEEDRSEFLSWLDQTFDGEIPW